MAAGLIKDQQDVTIRLELIVEAFSQHIQLWKTSVGKHLRALLPGPP